MRRFLVPLAFVLFQAVLMMPALAEDKKFVTPVAVGHQRVASDGSAGQLRYLVGHGLHRTAQLVDFIGHRTRGIDQKHQVQPRLLCRQGAVQPHLQRVALAAFEDRAALQFTILQ